MPDIRNPIQRFFWDKLTNGGLDLVDGNRVDKLVDYVKKNAIDGQNVAPSEGREIDAFERTALKELLDSNSWRSLLTDDGVARLETSLGIESVNIRSNQGRDAIGSVPRGSVAGNFAGALTDGKVELRRAGELFTMDYQRKVALFTDEAVPEKERAAKALNLFEDYAKAINKSGSGPEAVQARQGLLKAFFATPLAKTYGAQDPDGDMLGTAWEIAWGTDPERPGSNFDVDKTKKWSAYMSMNGGFIDTAKKIDEVLDAQGRPAKAEAFEKKSPLNWIIAEETGNTKPSSRFTEATAISSTGVDFAKKLLKDESVIGERTLDPGFDMKVDFYAWDNFVTLNKGRGETLVARHDDSGEDLQVGIEKVGDTHWKPTFKTAAGEDVAVDKVTNVIIGADGELKGDGKATGSYSASWWGFCDRNAMQSLVTMKYGIPQPERDVTIKVGEKDFTFTKTEVRNIVGRRLTEIFPNHTQAGNRYDANPDEVHLKNGSVLSGKITSEVDFYHTDTYRMGDSMVVLADRANAPMGSFGITTAEGDKEIAAGEIEAIRRAPQSATLAAGTTADTIVLKDGSEVSGSLITNVNFSAATNDDGTLVLKNSAAVPLHGDLVMTTTRGDAKRIPSDDLAYVVREDQKDILAEEALAYVVRNKGIFSADSWSGASVANGTRTIEEIKRWDATSADKPTWIPADTKELSGYRGKVENPENVVFFGMGNKGTSYGGLKFWMEMDENRNPVNSNIISGQWDFLWGVEGKPDWDAKATFNPNVPNDLVLKLYVNSLDDPSKADELLPEGWRDALEPQPEQPAGGAPL